MNIKELCVAAHNNSANHGFWDDYNQTLSFLPTCLDIDKYTLDIKLSKIALIMSELGEAVEGIRKPTADPHCPGFSSEEIEMADVLIRIFDYCEAFGLDLAGAVTTKMAFNQTRPYKHSKGA